MEEKLTDLPIKSILSMYKRLIRNAPIAVYSTDKDMDDYYNKLIEIETEIISRTNNR